MQQAKIIIQMRSNVVIVSVQVIVHTSKKHHRQVISNNGPTEAIIATISRVAQEKRQHRRAYLWRHILNAAIWGHRGKTSRCRNLEGRDARVTSQTRRSADNGKWLGSSWYLLACCSGKLGNSFLKVFILSKKI